MIKFSDKTKQNDSKPAVSTAKPAATDGQATPAAKVEEPAVVKAEPKK